MANTSTLQKGNARIRELDALRGLAIIGTLGTNIWTFAMAGGDLAVLFGPRNWVSDFGAFLQTFVLFLTNGKFLGVLAILFGIGLELQRLSAERAGRRFLPWYAKRNLVLLLIGFLHFVFIYGFDILMGYALASVIAGWLAIGSIRRLKTGIIIGLVVHVLVYGLALLTLNSDGRDAAAEFAAQALKTGSYLETVLLRLNMAFYFRVEVITLLGLNTALIGLGVLLIRSGLFAGTRQARALAIRLLIIGLTVGIPLNLVAFAQDARLAFAGRYFFAPIMALGYIGAGALLFRHLHRFAKAGLETIGRTALSCYIGQNLVAATLFYGWGAGLKGLVTPMEVVGIWLAITAAYTSLLHFWLKRHPQGPVEWAWRRLAGKPKRATASA